MALAVTIRFDFLDNKGKTSFTEVRVPTGFSIANYIEFAEDYAELLSQLSTAQITRTSINVSLDISGATIKAAATAISDIAQKAFAQFGTAVTGFRSRMKLPAILETLVVTGTDALNQAQADVAAWIASNVSGIAVTGGTVSPCDDRENDITSLQTLVEQFRRTATT